MDPVVDTESVSDDANDAQQNDSDDMKDSDDDEVEDNKISISKEGYLQQESGYWKKLKKRYIILKENHLFCYTDHQKTEISELINLAKFEKIGLCPFNETQLDLLPLYDNQ